MIEIRNLTKKYEDVTVLDVTELNIPRGQSFGLVGNNGAGKTTLFSLLLDLISPTTGYIKSNGIQVDQSEEWKSKTTAFIDDSFLIGYLTPEEYFYFIGELRGWSTQEVDTFLIDFNDFFANGKMAPNIMAIMAGFIP
jgi:ABC-2 type transport system ATP-binding protein